MNKSNTIYGKSLIDTIFLKCGIQIKGSEPFDIQIYHPQFYQKILNKWSLGLGESYMDGDWGCAQ